MSNQEVSMKMRTNYPIPKVEENTQTNENVPYVRKNNPSMTYPMTSEDDFDDVIITFIPGRR